MIEHEYKIGDKVKVICTDEDLNSWDTNVNIEPGGIYLISDIGNDDVQLSNFGDGWVLVEWVKPADEHTSRCNFDDGTECCEEYDEEVAEELDYKSEYHYLFKTYLKHLELYESAIKTIKEMSKLLDTGE